MWHSDEIEAWLASRSGRLPPSGPGPNAGSTARGGPTGRVGGRGGAGTERCAGRRVVRPASGNSGHPTEPVGSASRSTEGAPTATEVTLGGDKSSDSVTRGPFETAVDLAMAACVEADGVVIPGKRSAA